MAARSRLCAPSSDSARLTEDIQRVLVGAEGVVERLAQSRLVVDSSACTRPGGSLVLQFFQSGSKQDIGRDGAVDLGKQMTAVSCSLGSCQSYGTMRYTADTEEIVREEFGLSTIFALVESKNSGGALVGKDEWNLVNLSRLEIRVHLTRKA